MNKIEFSKLKNKEDMILAFNQLKDDYRQLFAINEDLQEENEFLKLDNPEMNIEHFRIIKENKRKIDNLRKENERLNNVINELEKYIKQIQHGFPYSEMITKQDILDKLKELKEGK